MSGTSLDGLDLALCHFYRKEKNWRYEIIKTRTIEYPDLWVRRLANAHHLNSWDLIMLDKAYGVFIGESVNDFLLQCKTKPLIIASHGHTVFHAPDQQTNLQIGNGNVIAAVTGITTIFDFRSLDIALNGQGAPLVPAGDELLFGEFDYCLNLGGFANISYKVEGKRIAFDICPVNIIINRYSQLAGKPFDMDGRLASSGVVKHDLLNMLNKISFYGEGYPKSLSREWLDNQFIPILERFEYSIEDMLRTLYEHIAIQIGEVLNEEENGSRALVTGGGANNRFLIERIQDRISNNLFIPDDQLIAFKEAIVFAFLGVLRLNGEINCFSSVTGADRDSCSGTIVKG